MRQFSSYGPVDCEEHFCVERKGLVERCLEQLIGNPEKGGHYFTLWAPRQTGKTWLMRQVEEKIKTRYKEKFSIHCFSLGNLRGMHFEPASGMKIPVALSDVLELGLPGNPVVKTWKEFDRLFSKNKGLWKKPLILLIDEVDTAPPELLDLIVGRFREIYLDPRNNHLHGMAMIGVRAVLGVDSERGSPFNIQRSLHVPNFTREEVNDLFQQYRDESGQEVEPEVVRRVFEYTRGQPGLVGWFGELLTEKFNPGRDKIIGVKIWNDTFRRACTTEWNNTVLNLLKKSKGEYRSYIINLFSRSDIPFSIDTEWCNYAYLNGIIDIETMTDPQGGVVEVCRFSSPFIQHRLYNALTRDIIGERLPILALELTDRITDILNKTEFDLPGLMKRYKAYLRRLKNAGLNPWTNQPRRTDMHLTEAVGHFHLYAWLKEAVDGICRVSPEFPTGNGKVDLHIACGAKRGIIEVKSFTSLVKTESAKLQAAAYAKSLSLDQALIALSVPWEMKMR
ncbi:MAG: hypothetical protein JJV89_03125 [Desulfosarcina sp.]|nr:hypothetical protein [Desulfobacterales bacterium]